MSELQSKALAEAAADQWKVLPSGLTVLVRPMPGYSGTHVIYATRFGSIDRDFRLNGREVHLPAGVAHFLEHKMFEDQDGDAFAKFAKTGANANAFTSFDRTCYLFTATQQLDESLDVLLGMVGHPYFTEQTIAKEQGIIGQEIKMYDDSADWRLITGLCECLYHSHPIRSDIAGSCESIAEITPGMLYDCCEAFYAPGNMVLAAAGNTTMEQVLAACARHGLLDPPPRRAGAAPLGRRAYDAGGCGKAHPDAGLEALLRPRLQGSAPGTGRPAQRDAVRPCPLLHLRRHVAALPPPVRFRPDQSRLRRGSAAGGRLLLHPLHRRER